MHVSLMVDIAERRWTAEEVRALPDDPRHRYEVVDGMLIVSPSPNALHQAAVIDLVVPLRAFVRATVVGDVMTSPADIELDVATLLQPDVFVTALFNGRRPRRWSEVRLLLAIEVLSPSTARYDRGRKRHKYVAQGIELWLVDLDARVIECWRPGASAPDICDERVSWQPSGAAEPFVLELPAYFTEVLGEP
jgi:Uma2 family endonuclease